jgi:hypothetical protein
VIYKNKNVVILYVEDVNKEIINLYVSYVKEKLNNIDLKINLNRKLKMISIHDFRIKLNLGRKSKLRETNMWILMKI